MTVGGFAARPAMYLDRQRQHAASKASDEDDEQGDDAQLQRVLGIGLWRIRWWRHDIWRLQHRARSCGHGGGAGGVHHRQRA